MVGWVAGSRCGAIFVPLLPPRSWSGASFPDVLSGAELLMREIGVANVLSELLLFWLIGENSDC